MQVRGKGVDGRGPMDVNSAVLQAQNDDRELFMGLSLVSSVGTASWPKNVLQQQSICVGHRL